VGTAQKECDERNTDGSPDVAGLRQRLVRARQGSRVNPQTLARVTGVLFLITYVTSIPAALVLYVLVLTDPGYTTGPGGADSGVLLGAFLEMLLIIANIGTALALFPILKRQNEVLALGYVAARVVECVFIAIGIYLTVKGFRPSAAASEPARTATNEVLSAA
jgi:hypothetical protein